MPRCLATGGRCGAWGNSYSPQGGWVGVLVDSQDALLGSGSAKVGVVHNAHWRAGFFKDGASAR
jgi:hypothetical protein